MAIGKIHLHLAAGVYACGRMSPPVLRNLYSRRGVTCKSCLRRAKKSDGKERVNG